MAKKKRTSRRLKIVGGLVVALLLIAVVGSVTGVFGGGPRGLAVEAEEAERRDITQVVTAFGRVQPEVEVKISPDVSGEIVELPVREGDQVKKGDLLAAIQPDFYAAQVEQAEAGVKQAKATLAQRRADLLQAEAEYERQRNLFERNVISQSDLEQAKTAYEVAEASYEAAQYQVESAEAQQREAGEQLSRTRLYAPMDGTVSKLDVEPGERVVGTSQMSGTEMMRIARLGQMELEVDVNENDVVNVAEGDTAAIEVDAYPERSFRGMVTEIANSARVSGEGTQEQVTNFPVKIRILDAHNVGYRGGEDVAADDVQSLSEEEMPLSADAALPPIFRPGMSGTVDVFTQTETDVVSVPIQAVTVRDFNAVRPPADQDSVQADAEQTEAEEPAAKAAGPRKEDLRKVVFTIGPDGEAEMVEVETGISDDTHIVVKRGLEGGERVVIGPYRAVSSELSPGMEVRVEEPTAPRQGGRS